VYSRRQSALEIVSLRLLGGGTARPRILAFVNVFVVVTGASLAGRDGAVCVFGSVKRGGLLFGLLTD